MTATLGKFLDHCEDSLTAAVFTHLLHLPVEAFWRILRNACYTDRLPHHCGELISAEAWPNWDPTGTNNPSRVVPDLFLRFPLFDLIIEAKRWDDGMQSRVQWRNELIAYSNEYGHEERDVRLIAVGGIHTEQDDGVPHDWVTEGSRGEPPERSYQVHMCRWRRLLEQCKRMRRELERLEFGTSQTAATMRILDDAVSLFAFHGYHSGLWFRDFNFDRHRLSNNINQHSLSFRYSRASHDPIPPIR